MRFGGRPVERCDRHAHQTSSCVSEAIASGDVGEQRAKFSELIDLFGKVKR